MLQKGDLAPDFELPADDGRLLRLSSLRGKKIVLFFYPKADTPGCTLQACEMRDHQDDFDTAGAVVLGISPDPVADVAAFRRKYGLTFRLLADERHEVAELYGVWKEKTLFGHRYMGAERTTFVIDEAGRIAEVLGKVKPEGHAGLVLSGLRGTEH